VKKKKKPPKKPPKKSSRAPKHAAQPDRLKGWAQIAKFLGQPVAVAQRWARSGMPITREGRFRTASTEELSRYMGRESGLDVPVHIATRNPNWPGASDLYLIQLLAAIRPRNCRYASSRSRPLEAGGPRLGIADRNDTCWVYCVFHISRNGSSNCSGRGRDEVRWCKKRCVTLRTTTQTLSSSPKSEPVRVTCRERS
jgi:hypothetical protein